MEHDTADHFIEQHAWVAEYLKKPNTIWRTVEPRIPKPPHVREDTLFTESLGTPSTIKSWIVFYQQPSSPEEEVDEIFCALDFGDGLNGNPKILHGGIISSTVDEAQSILHLINAERKVWGKSGKKASSGQPLRSTTPDTAWFTAQLDVKYMKPVVAPGPAIVTAKVKQYDRRKAWATSEFRQKQDGREIVCASALGLYIGVPKTKL